jgi:response regulator RpfG family c-di-GMP phosphodiesterase
MLYPIGHVTLPPELLTKVNSRAKLTREEQQVLTEAPGAARSLILNIPRLKAVAETVYFLNKDFKGWGYPNKLVKGTDIPLGARMLRILKDLAEIDESEWPTYAAFEKIAANSKAYDPQVFAMTRRVLEVSGDIVEDSKAIQELPVDLLEPGQVLESDVLTLDGKLVLAKGNRLTPILIKRLNNWHFTYGVCEPLKIARTG